MPRHPAPLVRAHPRPVSGRMPRRGPRRRSRARGPRLIEPAGTSSILTRDRARARSGSAARRAGRCPAPASCAIEVGEGVEHRDRDRLEARRGRARPRRRAVVCDVARRDARALVREHVGRVEAAAELHRDAPRHACPPMIDQARRCSARAAPASSVTTTPTATAASRPAVEPDERDARARSRTRRGLIRAQLASVGMSISPITATNTIDASVASGSRLSTGPRNSATSTARATVTSVDSCVLRAGALVHRALREAAGGGHRREERPRDVGGARGQQLLVAVDRRLVRLADAACHGRRLEEGHDGDREGAGHQRADLDEVRDAGHRQAAPAPARSGRRRLRRGR